MNIKVNKITQRLRHLNIMLGIISVIIFAFNLIVFNRLQPKMIAFQALVGVENYLMTIVGFGLMAVLVFFIVSFFQIARCFQITSKIDPINLIVLISTVISLLFVFSDVALLSDINKQYLDKLDQPEWALVYPVIGFQAFTTIVLLGYHISGRFIKTSNQSVGRDTNIYLIVQYVGVICGLMGLAVGFLGFLFPKGWSPSIHSVLTTLILLFPYTLAICYWGLTKLKEKNRQWFDEKQQRDTGRSALNTLLITSFFMVILFVVNFHNLNGVVRFLWLPLYIFVTIFLFSLGNLIFSAKA